MVSGCIWHPACFRVLFVSTCQLHKQHFSRKAIIVVEFVRRILRRLPYTPKPSKIIQNQVIPSSKSTQSKTIKDEVHVHSGFGGWHTVKPMNDGVHVGHVQKQKL
jgi:hypothetical protein